METDKNLKNMHTHIYNAKSIRIYPNATHTNRSSWKKDILIKHAIQLFQKHSFKI